MAAVVLGCGLGLDATSSGILGLGLLGLRAYRPFFRWSEVAYLAKAGKASALTAVAGVDFAWPAIQA